MNCTHFIFIGHLLMLTYFLCGKCSRISILLLVINWCWLYFMCKMFLSFLIDVYVIFFDWNISMNCTHFIFIGHYHLLMWVGNVFGHVCVSVCVCLSVCVSVCSAYNFWTLWWPYLGQILVSRSFGQGQGHMRKKDNFTYFNLLVLCMWLQVINKVKVTHQGEGHIKVKVKISSSLPTLCKILLISTY